MKFSIKDFFSKCDQIRRKLQIWSHLLKKSLMVNFIFLRSVYPSTLYLEQSWILASDIVQKIELFPKKVASQRTQLSGLKLKKSLLPTSWNSQVFGKHRPFLLWFSFYEHFNRQFIYSVFFIFQTVRCI